MTSEEESIGDEEESDSSSCQGSENESAMCSSDIKSEK